MVLLDQKLFKELFHAAPRSSAPNIRFVFGDNPSVMFNQISLVVVRIITTPNTG